MTFTQLKLIQATSTVSTDHTVVLADGSFPVTFKKADQDFFATTLDEVVVPEGRYAGVQICYQSQVGVKVSAETYKGLNGTAFSDGASVTTSSSSSATLATSGTAVSTQFTPNNLGQCSETYFPKVACVTSSESDCQSSDMFVNTGSALPTLNILVDLRHAVTVDANAGTIENTNFRPYALLGSPGAGVHLSYSNATGSGSEEGDVSVLLDREKRVIYASGLTNVGLSPGLAGFCSGVSYVADNSGSLVNASKIDTSGANAGRLQYAASRQNNVSEGVLTVSNLFAAAASNVTVTCVADDLADPAYLGFAYPKGAGKAGSTTTWKVQRVVDPTNITGNCASSPCGSY
jgi:hypothetical protein